MPWLLQPKNWEQARWPNLYNVNYGRVGTYKGMGGLGQDITDIFAGGTQAIDSSGNVYTKIGGAWVPLAGGTEPVVTQPSKPSTTQNWLPFAIGGGVLLLLLAAGGRR